MSEPAMTRTMSPESKSFALTRFVSSSWSNNASSTRESAAFSIAFRDASTDKSCSSSPTCQSKQTSTASKCSSMRNGPFPVIETEPCSAYLSEANTKAPIEATEIKRYSSRGLRRWMRLPATLSKMSYSITAKALRYRPKRTQYKSRKRRPQSKKTTKQ